MTTLDRLKDRIAKRQKRLEREQDRLMALRHAGVPRDHWSRVELEERVIFLLEELGWLRELERILSGQGQETWNLIKVDGKTVPLQGGKSKWASQS